jgi:multiple sugar transport system substrate-binding protein
MSRSLPPHESMDDFEARVRSRLQERSAVASGDVAALETFARRIAVREPRRRFARPAVRWPAFAGIAVAFVALVGVGALVAGPLLLAPAPSPKPSASGSSSPSPSAAPCTTPTTVRWFIGLGAGSQPYDISPYTPFLTSYNERNTDCIHLKTEIIPNANAADVLRTEIAAGNAPDIIGPVATQAAGDLSGLFLDLNPLIRSQNYDTAAYEPALLKYLQEGGAQLGLPYSIFPGYILYSKEAFSKAGLPPLPTKVGQTYQGKTWDWNTLAEVAAQLTLDAQGKNPTQTGFDHVDIMRDGISFEYPIARRFASAFGGGSFVAPDGLTAQIPDAWRDAFNWYYDAMKGHYASNGLRAMLIDLGEPQVSDVTRGWSAMEVSWPWAIGSYGMAGMTWLKNWDMGVIPSWKGQTSSPLDMDSFRIAGASKNPVAAFKAMTAILADPDMRKFFTGMPARTADQQAWFTATDATLATIFPGNSVTWSVLQEMSRYPALPSHDAYMPNRTKAASDADAFVLKLQTTPDGLDVNAALDKLKATLQADFDAVKPLG